MMSWLVAIFCLVKLLCLKFQTKEHATITATPGVFNHAQRT